MACEENKIAYGFVTKVRDNLEELGLKETQVALDVGMYRDETEITFDYSIETLDWVEEGLNKDSVTYLDSYTFNSEEDVVPDRQQIKEFLEGNFLEAALRLDDEVLREDFSNYDAF